VVCLVHLASLVYPVDLVQPNKRDKLNKPNNGLLTLAGFFSVLLGAAVEREYVDCRVVTRAIDFNSEVGAGG
jgi:hypothetical protein